jgi:hypothetical protein
MIGFSRVSTISLHLPFYTRCATMPSSKECETQVSAEYNKEGVKDASITSQIKTQDVESDA